MSDKDPLSGTWKSSVGSTLELQVDGAALSGTFESTEVPGAGPRPVRGSVDPSPATPNRALAFTVQWDASGDHPAGVTSYTGRFQQHDGSTGKPRIDTLFLLAKGGEGEDDYRAVNIGHDHFERA